MQIEAARHALLAQHEEIRGHLFSCVALAQRLLRGEPVHFELEAALGRLRADFNEHNMTETRLVRSLLQDSPKWGTVLLDRMLEEHVAEHAAFWDLLGGTVGEVAARMEDLVDELDAHMAAEERTFLSPHVLREDVITRHRRKEPQ